MTAFVNTAGSVYYLYYLIPQVFTDHSVTQRLKREFILFSHVSGLP